MDICISNFHYWLPQSNIDDSLDNAISTDDIEWPKLSFVPAMQRRRLSAFAKIALYVANDTMADSQESLPIIFSSRHGDLHKTSTLLEDLAIDNELSPTAFGLSVHNAIPSLYSILTGNKQAINAIAAGKDSFFMALVDAYARLKSGICQQVLLIHADQHLPEVYANYQDEIQIPHAMSMIVTLDSKALAKAACNADINDGIAINCNYTAVESTPDSSDATLPSAVAFAKWFTSSSERLIVNTNQYTWLLGKYVTES